MKKHGHRRARPRTFLDLLLGALIALTIWLLDVRLCSHCHAVKSELHVARLPPFAVASAPLRAVQTLRLPKRSVLRQASVHALYEAWLSLIQSKSTGRVGLGDEGGWEGRKEEREELTGTPRSAAC